MSRAASPSGRPVKILLMLGVFAVGVLSAVVGAGHTSLLFPVIQLAAGLIGGAVAITRVHHLWPMAVSFALALIVLSAHRIDLVLSPVEAPLVVAPKPAPKLVHSSDAAMAGR